jgi:adenylate kinase family enzyme
MAARQGGKADLVTHSRIVIVGTSCSGKTTLARQLAHALDLRHVELDRLNWGPDWTKRPDFRERVHDAVGADRWVVDGNYSEVRDLVWPRATAIVWLNLPFHVVLAQALLRTFRRILMKDRLYAGNRETFAKAFFDRDSILLWVLRSYHRRRRDYRLTLTTEKLPHMEIVELGSRRAATAFASRLSAASPESGPPGPAP